MKIIMKTTFRLFQIFLLMCGVFGEDEVKTVSLSVMEGDSVTLNPDPTKMQGFIQILWRFGNNGPLIAQIDRNEISYANDGIFRDRLQLNQTGSLTIKNTRTKHSGLYKAEVDHRSGQLYINFIVTVYESPSVVDAGEAETKSVSVKEGDSVTLQTDIPELHGDELMVWRFGGEGKLIAKSDIETKSSPLYENTDERFRDRLQLNNQTGSLTIKNMKNTDSGLYTVTISSSKQMINKRFIVTVSDKQTTGSGLSSGAVAGIVVFVLLVIAAAASIVIYYRHKISEGKRSEINTISVMEGQYITLNPGTDIDEDDEIQWLFGDEETCIAASMKEKTSTERFNDNLELDKLTGSLKFNKIAQEQTGLYKMKIISKKGKTSCKTFHLNISLKMVAVKEGKPIILVTGAKIEEDDQIQWIFEDGISIAEITERKKRFDYADERFRGKLELDIRTGDLTIIDSTVQHAGPYKLMINKVPYETFIVVVKAGMLQKSRSCPPQTHPRI